METATILAMGVVFVAVWVAANRRHVDRREHQAAEWAEDEARPDLWTSSAACVHCGAPGGLLELKGDDTHFTCLACGKSHVRETRA